MTRFARARGSKASNERAPEDGTPWEVMREQLLQAKKDSEDSKNRKEAEQKRIENYENFLKEHKTQKRKATWCDFPESESKRQSETIDTPVKTKKNITKNKASKVTELLDKNEDKGSRSKMIIKKPKKKQTSALIKLQNENHSLDVAEPVKHNKKKNKQKKKNSQTEETSSSAQTDTQIHTNQNLEKSEEKPVNIKGKKKNKKNKKLVDGKPVRRKEINDHSFQLIINGKDIELVRFDGFPVMKKDADRLLELKNNMIKKGIPKSEVQRTIKLERRRAEKALARVKRDVCYNCRKGGHVLSDCPELKSKIPGAEGAADGVCFKCGSTEHRQFECKVQRDKEFRFATCFICKEPGHIARQCPDNPKGLYPNGGSCKLCGDVTHLRKDCPTVTDKKEESTVKLHTLDGGENIEDVQQSTKATPVETIKKPKKIKF